MTMNDYRIPGDTGDWEVVIGLEVHAQVTSNAKLFSGAATAFGAEPNTQVSLVDAAMPGMLPVPNRECIRQAVRTGLAIDAKINKWSRFDRKNYFYADLPQGYQISQLYHPLVGEGAIEIALDEKNPDGATKTIGVERIHVEQDAGKLMHDQHPTRSYVDLNRSGVALMEIVSRPDMRSPAERGLTCESCVRSCAMSGRAMAIWRRARCAPTSTSACASPAQMAKRLRSARGPRRRTSIRSAS